MRTPSKKTIGQRRGFVPRAAFEAFSQVMSGVARRQNERSPSRGKRVGDDIGCNPVQVHIKHGRIK